MTYLKKVVQNSTLDVMGVGRFHGDTLLQTLSLLMLEEHLGDVLSEPFVDHVHTQLKYTHTHITL